MSLNVSKKTNNILVFINSFGVWHDYTETFLLNLVIFPISLHFVRRPKIICLFQMGNLVRNCVRQVILFVQVVNFYLAVKETMSGCRILIYCTYII